MSVPTNGVNGGLEIIRKIKKISIELVIPYLLPLPSSLFSSIFEMSLAVGDKEFVIETKAKLGAKAIGRRELENIEGYELKEHQRVGS